VQFLVDSGANPNLISVEVFRDLPEDTRARLRPARTKLVAANDEAIKTLGEVRLYFQVQGHVFQDDFVVADLGPLQGILGMRFLQGANAYMGFKDGVLCCGDLRLQLQASKPESFSVRLVKQIRIPAGHGFVAKAVVDAGLYKFPTDPWVACLECQGGVIEENGVVAPRSVVSVSVEDGRQMVEVAFTNFSQQEQVLEAGEIVAKLEPIDESQLVQRCSKIAGDGPLVSAGVPEHLGELSNSAGANLSPDQKQQVDQLLIKFASAFAGPDGALGGTGLVTHSIDTQGSAPVRCRYRPPGYAMRQMVDENVDKMLELGVIEPTVSPWSSPVVLVKKKDGSIRFCVDLRRVNAATKKDAYALPNIGDCLGSLAGNEWFCTLDLASGYWQVAMSTQDKEKTAFSTHRGQFAFNRMPFGLCNAPATFMRLMEMVLRGLEWERCLVYLDDVIVFGKDFSSCLENLESVLGRFQEAGLKLKASKCDLFQKEVAFLGHRVSTDGLSCDPAKLSAVEAWPRPESGAEVRSFLGLANYYKRFVQNFSEVALPLTNLTRQATAFVWDEQCETSFNQLKQLLTSAPTLGYPSGNAGDLFILDTDASQYALGAVLSQVQGGEEKVIAYASKGLTSSQRNYCTTYRELLAIVEFVPYFKHYLLGRRFQIRTDHSSLRWFHTFRNAEGLVGRWHATLANFDYELVYRPGPLHGNADALSRHPTLLRKRRCGTTSCDECQGANATTVPVCSVQTTPRAESDSEEDEEVQPAASYVRPITEVGSNWVPSWSLQDMQEMQQRDEGIAAAYSWVERGHPPNQQERASHSLLAKNLSGLWTTLVIRDGLVYRRWESPVVGETHQLLAPSDIRAEIFRQLHTVRQGGHFGVRRTVAVVRQRFFWPGMRTDVERWCKECETCQRTKTRPTRRATMQHESVGSRFERVAIDIMGELPVTESGNRYILVISDYFTKWTQAFPLPNQMAATVADALVTNCFSLFGMPRWLHSDQGSNFESELFRELCKLLDIRKTRTVAYHPQSDGQVERFNRTMKQMIKAFVNDNMSDWDDQLPLLMMAYRASPQESTGVSPNLMMYGEECALPLDVMVEAPPRQTQRCHTEYVEWLRQTLGKAHSFARKQLKVAAKHQKLYYDRKAKPHPFQVGQHVWYWYDPLAKRKFGCGWSGPYRVLACPTETHCVLSKVPGDKPRKVHVNKLKPHFGRVPPAWAEFDNRQVPSESPNVDSGSEQADTAGDEEVEPEATERDPYSVSAPSALPRQPVSPIPIPVPRPRSPTSPPVPLPRLSLSENLPPVPTSNDSLPPVPTSNDSLPPDPGVIVRPGKRTVKPPTRLNL
jgi:hypothetical protein